MQKTGILDESGSVSNMTTSLKKMPLSQLDKIANSVPGVIYEIEIMPDKTNRFTYLNDEVENLYEVSQEAALQDANLIYARIHPEDLSRCQQEASAAMVAHTPFYQQYRVLLPKAGLKWLASMIRSEFLPDGRVMMRGLISDVTQQKERELRIAEADKLVTLGQMSASIVHEINNPLSVIKGKMDLLGGELKNQNIDLVRFSNYIQTTSQMIQRIDDIIHGMRRFAGSSDDRLRTEVALTTMIHDAMLLCSARFKSSNFPLSCHELPAAWVMHCQPVQISQVLVNLLGNALDAVNDLQERWVKVTTEEVGSHYRISVIDSGSGIPDELKTKILEPFFTTKPVGQGTGLGLSISAEILSNHQGKLEIDTEAGHTRISLLLPKKAGTS